MKEISVHEFKDIIEKQRGNPEVDFINVCTPAEHREKCIPGVRNVPLDSIPEHADTFAGKKTVYVHCRSGKRAARAITTLQSLGVSAELVNVSGGLLAWDDAGFPTTSATARLPIMRQVLLIAGLLVLAGVMLGWFAHPGFYLLTAGVGGGLIVAGATGWCGMAFMLAKMPWNN